MSGQAIETTLIGQVLKRLIIRHIHVDGKLDVSKGRHITEPRVSLPLSRSLYQIGCRLSFRG
jgi:hypothetical protein